MVNKYLAILTYLTNNIFCYYELKGNFVRSNEVDAHVGCFSEIIKEIHKKIIIFETITNNAIIFLNKQREKIKLPPIKNHINNTIQIALSMIEKVLTRRKWGGNNNTNTSDVEFDKEQSSYTKTFNYFFQTDMLGILRKYMCIANDRICSDSFNQMRTIKLNTFETSTLHFDMDDGLKARLIYEGYSKTIKHFACLLHIYEITGRQRSADEYLDSIERRYIVQMNR